ncbi:MAG: hopanoid biosynthesis protein HpnM [Betaproteobacteria bacterium]|nr:MAG: hopanoid biosynthesis protein HpnM [Betaproteobacteria bacterium]TMH04832.1 MAG: hopanoid biosynthesis protein HpnM [Betaproteobacteria bacterium]
MTALMGSIDRNDPYMKWRRLLLACATLLAASFSAGAASDAADPAVVKIRTFYDTLLTVMQQADKLGIRGRYDKLAPSIHTTFDLAAMTRIAIGPGWNSIAPEQQAALVENFSRMTIATYANRFDGYSGERFEVAPASEARTTGRIVRSKLVPSSGESITLDYLMRGSGDTWKVVDVYLSGTISELATRRSEFSAILNSGGPNALIESLRQQTGKMMRSSSAGPGAGAR